MQLTNIIHGKRAACLVAGGLGLAAFSTTHAAHAQTFTVTSGLDSGNNTLRAAVAAANASPGADTISFGIGGNGLHVITLTSGPLPQLTGPVTIDAQTEPGFVSAPIVELRNGTGMSSLTGLDLAGGLSAVRGLSITGWSTAVKLDGPGNDLLTNDRIGIDATGAQHGNTTGVDVATTSGGNSIGNCTSAGRNVISGNSTGVRLESSGTLVSGNWIGTGIAGTAAVDNTVGIEVPSGASSNTVGGSVAGCGNLISGNSIGIFIGGGTGTFVQGNLIGTDKNGTAAVANGTGVSLYNAAKSNTIGGTTAATRNVISGNGQFGVTIEGSGTAGNVVEGNYIGTNLAGTAALANGGGIQIDLGASGNTIGGSAAGAGNVISGNSANGVSIIDSGATKNVVAGNLVGLNAAGTASVPNQIGVVVGYGAASNTVGGTTAGARNVVSGNAKWGVNLTGTSTTNNLVEGNYIGPLASGTAAGGGSQSGILVDAGASSNKLGGTSTAARNVISGNTNLGIELNGSATTGNLVAANYVGVDATGASLLTNGDFFSAAIEIFSAVSTTVGGTSAGKRNVIAGTGALVDVFSGSKTHVQGDYLGTDATGTTKLGGSTGVYVGAGATSTVIGGSTSGAGNVISGTGTAVDLIGPHGTVVAGNRIGTNAAGNAAIANANGVAILGGIGNTIGGTTAAARNVIAGSTKDGVDLEGVATQGNLVQGNYIGTNAAGTAAIPNQTGVHLHGGANGNTIGGTTAGSGNLISGNSFDGVVGHDSGTNGNLVAGNRIGTDATGTAALPNFNGVVFYGAASGNTIGGTSASAANTIAFNSIHGIVIDGSTTAGDTIERNSIYASGVSGILLSSGGNHTQPAPAVTSVTTNATITTIKLTLTGFAPTTSFRLETFLTASCGAGEGQTFLGSKSAATDGAGHAVVTISVPAVPAGRNVTATATNAANHDSSAFSGCAVTP